MEIGFVIAVVGTLKRIYSAQLMQAEFRQPDKYPNQVGPDS